MSIKNSTLVIGVASIFLLAPSYSCAQSYLDEAMGQNLSKNVMPSDASQRNYLNNNIIEVNSVLSDGALANVGSQALSKLQPDRGNFSRSINNARLFRQVSPAVVLVVTDSGFGSGVLLDKEGLIITNWHVISGAKEIGVIFKPAREGAAPTKNDVRRATLIKFDEVVDLALLKVNVMPASITPIRLGSTSDIGVGIDVHAIGHPTGEAWTYTKGVISQYRENYEWRSSSKQHKASVIQTQTPINPGNSGGPLLVDSGVMVGVNSFKANKTEGLNFAVAIDEIKRFLARSGNRLSNSPSQAPKKQDTPCEPKEIYRGSNQEKSGEILGIDLDCDGAVDAELRTPNDVKKPIIFAFDRNKDSHPDVMIFDFERKGKWELSFWDNDYDGKWDMVGHHDNGSIKASRFEPYDSFVSAGK